MPTFGALVTFGAQPQPPLANLRTCWIILHTFRKNRTHSLQGYSVSVSILIFDEFDQLPQYSKHLYFDEKTFCVWFFQNLSKYLQRVATLLTEDDQFEHDFATFQHFMFCRKKITQIVWKSRGKTFLMQILQTYLQRVLSTSDRWWSVWVRFQPKSGVQFWDILKKLWFSISI